MLPKITHPLYDFKIPSSGVAVKFRPFTVREEKLLLMAKESKGDRKAIFDVYRQLVQNCVVGKIDVDELAPFDVEAFFIALRSKSVGNIIEAKIKHDDGDSYDIAIDLDAVKVDDAWTKKQRTVMISPEIGVVLRYPSFAAAVDAEGSKNRSLALLKACIDVVFQGDDVHEFARAPADEQTEFLNSLGPKQLEAFDEFFKSFPRVYVDVEYTTKGGERITKALQGIESFFG
ncbi:MAG: hypothetical protein DDT26_00666 [Dehalococcoidia bacterium]|nr:hypothetical protein [Chloroflexota bacterium]